MTTAAASPGPTRGDGFRADINGLRAISVLAVVAYHFAHTLVPGGFLGVDVFFVISGFLMTNIIVGRLGRGGFSLWGFYGDRTRRIVPALTVMCAMATLVGAVALDPWTYQHLTAFIPETLLFVSNFVFAGRGGYFAPSADSEWLLHTWSLSVEWQFYLTYPLFLLLLWRIPALKRRLGALLIAGAIASFALGLALGPHKASWVFYLEPTRAWELLSGGLCACYAPAARMGAWTRRGAHLAGLVLIGLSLVLLNDHNSWPSPWTVVPVLGAALVIAAGVGDVVWARWPGVGLIGRSSYSTYIWHWPLILAMRYAGLDFTPAAIVAGILASLVLGLASYWLVERWLTSAIARLGGRARWTVGVASLVVVAGISATASTTGGFEAVRTAGLPPAVRASLTDDRAARDDWVFETECGTKASEGGLLLCRLGDPAARAVLVIGDSYASMIAPRYARPRGGTGVTFLARGGCAPLPGLAIGSDASACLKWTGLAFRYAGASPYRRIVLIANWPAYFDAADPAPTEAAFRKLGVEISRLMAAGKQVVLVGPMPSGGEAQADPEQLYRRTFWSGDTAASPFARSAFEAATAPVRRRLVDLAASTGATYIEPLDSLCPNSLCPVQTDGRAIYKDGRHFRSQAVSDPRFAVLDPWLDPPADSAAAPQAALTGAP